ncbi:flagellar hook-associated protein FlgK [Longirhabdus pacifica]|uniref:flagellar hook-associated protein FlgK n=1 Tax=Longirhabdus pacifica TaxID=2305227 RepID=UPI001008CB54|nr:flagellar hook-associated protein FlgK [Longirhabdus pacifica]
MRSTFHTLTTARRALFTQNTAIATLSHNIANADTEGFTRQRVNMKATTPIEAFGLMRSTSPGQLGTGVEVSSISRLREGFLDSQFRNESKELGSWSVQMDTLGKLETVVNEPSDSGIREVMDEFWKAWSVLSSDISTKSEELAARTVLKEKTIALTSAFNLMSRQLTELSTDLTSNIGVKATQVDTLSSSIATLNDEIQRLELLGDNANDLRDQRDLLTDELSEIVNITVTENDQGYTIQMGGITLTDGENSIPVDAAFLESAVTSGDLISGEVKGMIESRDRYVSDMQVQLDKMVDTLVNGEVEVTIPKGSVLPPGSIFDGIDYSGTLNSDITVTVKGINGLHRLGYHFNSPYVGGDFFTTKDGSANFTAANIELNPDIVENANLIATSMRIETVNGNVEVIKGNNTLALLMSELKAGKFAVNDQTTGVNEATIDDYFASIVGELAVESEEAQRQTSNYVIIVEQVEMRRQAISGVSINEEMTNMIQFQQAYNAAARTVTAFDEMLDKVINGMGVVGR